MNSGPAVLVIRSCDRDHDRSELKSIGILQGSSLCEMHAVMVSDSLLPNFYGRTSGNSPVGMPRLLYTLEVEMH
jgi:hypothetical protein